MSAAAAAVDGGLHWVAAQRADELRVEQQIKQAAAAHCELLIFNC